MRLFHRQYSHLDEERVINNYLAGIDTQNNFVVDIGAGDGVKMSNTYQLYKKGNPGGAIEYDSSRFKSLEANYAGLSNVSRINEKVFPENIAQILKSIQTPMDFLLLDLDIDGYDYFVLESILKAYRPIVIITEINEAIPPPLKFKVLPDENFVWKGGHFFGYSISCLDEIMETFNYSLVELHYNNAILIANDYWKGKSLCTEAAYISGYWKTPNRRKKFHYNNDLEYLFDLSPQQMAEHLEDYFSGQQNQYQLNY